MHALYAALIKPAINNLIDIPFELNYQLGRLCGINIIYPHKMLASIFMKNWQLILNSWLANKNKSVS